MSEKIEPIPFPKPSAELLELTEYCPTAIAETYALPRECFLPPRSRPVTIDLSSLFRKIYDNLGFKYTVDPGLPDDTMIVQTGKETKVFRIK